MAKKGSKVEALSAALADAEHGGLAMDALEKLVVLAKRDERAVDAIAAYAAGGKFGHVRSFATARLAKDLPSGVEAHRRPLFERLLDEPETRYWAVDGLLGSAGREAYPRIVRLALDDDARIEDRAKAVKALALHAGRTFDRGLPKDPGKWKAADLRLDEVRVWAADGFPPGGGHPALGRDAALDTPTTRLERAAARLDAFLSDTRGRDDPADPRSRLVPATPERLGEVLRTWSLPEDYAEFLRRFSPVGVTVETERYWNGGLRLYGVDDLARGQIGYAVDANGAPLPGWPVGHVVIAAHAGDPLTLDLTRGSRTTAPVCSAGHGRGNWSFRSEWGSFPEFLESLTGKEPPRLMNQVARWLGLGGGAS